MSIWIIFIGFMILSWIVSMTLEIKVQQIFKNTSRQWNVRP